VQKTGGPISTIYISYDVFLRKELPFWGCDDCTCVKILVALISERELTFTFAICCRPSVCLSSVTLVRPTQAVEIIGNISPALGTLAIH